VAYVTGVPTTKLPLLVNVWIVFHPLVVIVQPVAMAEPT